jgi:hypothetical protein
MKLSITQIALGLLILAIVLTCPAYLLIVAVPSLAVFGVGIAQLINVMKKTHHEISLEKESLI